MVSLVQDHPFCIGAGIAFVALSAFLLSRKAAAQRKWRTLRESGVERVRKLLQEQGPPPLQGKGKYWVLANPIGGDGKALRIYQEIVKPLFDEARVEHALFLTEYSGHAQVLGKAANPEEVACVVVISGDGMVHQVLNGFAERCKAQPEALRAQLARMPLALVPSGSSNGLATSFGLRDPVEAVVAALFGTPQPLDVYEVALVSDTGERETYWDVHALCFGLFADHDRLCETKLRKFGVAAKGWLGGVIVLWNMNAYRCRIELQCRDDEYSSEQERLQLHYQDPRVLPKREQQGTPGRTWYVLDNTFLNASFMNTAWGASDAKCTPSSQRAGGAADLVAVPSKGVGRWSAIKWILGQETGEHATLPFVHIYRATAWRMFPDAADRGRTTVDLSGEQFPLPKLVEGKVHQGCARVMAL